MSKSSAQQQIFVTKDGLEKLKEELRLLKEVKRPEILKRLQEAVSYGDLSENSEYEEAKNEQAFVEGRIIELENKIKNVQIITEKKSKSKNDTVQIGTTVTIQNLTDEDKPETYAIVGSTEADPIHNLISNESPLGKALIGKNAGITVKVEAPVGILEYKIISLK